MRRDRTVVKGILAAGRAIDDLVCDHHVSWSDRLLQRAAGRRPDDARHSELLHRPEVCAIVDDVRRILMRLTVAGQKGDALAGDGSDREHVARRSIRRLDGYLARIFEKRVEARSAKDADLRCFLRHYFSVREIAAATLRAKVARLQ